MLDNRAADLKTRYTHALDAAMAEVESLNAASLRRRCSAQQCSAAALACHIAGVHATVAGWVQAILAGEALPSIAMADIDRSNAEQAALNDQIGKDEVLGRLRTSGEVMTAALGGLHDDDLARTKPFTLSGGDVSVQTLVEQAVIAHTAEHLASIRAAVATDGA